MQKRQMLLGIVAVVVLVAGGGAWWFLQQSAPVEEETVVVAPKPKPKAPAAPAPTPAATPAPPSDVVALSEEELDKIKAEAVDLAARAADLEEQVKDGEMIIDMKAKQIAKMQEELKQLESTQPAKK